MSFLHHPRQVHGRRWLFLFHLWAGLVIGFFLTVVGISGSILVFSDDIQRSFDVHKVAKVNSKTLNVVELAKIAQRQFPGIQIGYVSLSSDVGQAASVSTQDPFTRRAGNIYIHPQTGVIVAETVHREAFMDWIYRVHVYLLAGDTGYWFNGIFSALAVGVCVSGVVIWWPGLKIWKAALLVNRKARWKRQNYDLHRSVGFFASVFLAGVFLTGAYFRFPQPFIYVLGLLTGSQTRDLSVETFARNLPVIPAAQAVAQGEAAIPAAETVSLGFARNDLHYFRVDRRLPSGQTRTAAVDAYTGQVLEISSDQPANLSDRILGWSGPIHFGTWGGRVTQILWVFLGLAPGFLFITGVLMYWNRVLSKRIGRLPDRKRKQSVSELRAGLTSTRI